MMTNLMMITERLGESWRERGRRGCLGQSWTCSSRGDGDDGGDCAGEDGGDYDDDQVVTTLLGEWSQLLGSGRRLEEVCMWTTAVVDRLL